ncbi:unnamed protein product [Periconia digitata]|uniref:NACHT domain-containing protein n=1 Tax=Periconia digitata TaxID=1303443 RepID=A0A9W4UPJ2_9PLEO|nr:unnamed protein product [Periconia digitata]
MHASPTAFKTGELRILINSYPALHGARLDKTKSEPSRLSATFGYTYSSATHSFLAPTYLYRSRTHCYHFYRSYLSSIMRLLRRDSKDKFLLTKDFLGDDEVPRYAILSHTWGEEEILFQDLQNDSYRDKKSYNKIRFCGDQAEKDGIQYLWVDTCCINKADPVELQHSINSMYRWYQQAAKCYVYLTDVAALADEQNVNNEPQESTWRTAFRNSRWFTRGWTLQELLAPRNVEFFSVGGSFLGDKKSLGEQISNITGIQIQALEESRLHDFTINQRFSWVKDRQTTREEDKSYCLLGIFGVFMSLNYGEGKEHAFKRLRRKIEKSKQKSATELSREQQDFIKKLRVTEPSHDKKRIEDTKGGLLIDSYRWVLSNPDFEKWRTEDESRVLWIKGDPGKGKTMLLCGIINELEGTNNDTTLLSYFFCQSTDSRINNATAVLRSLICTLIAKRPISASLVEKLSADSNASMFEGINAWYALEEILEKVLEDLGTEQIVFVIDALDECTTDLERLLNLIVKISATPHQVKWIISSRNIPEIEIYLDEAQSRQTLSLELNAQMISEAVHLYIDHKVGELARWGKYDTETRQAVQKHFSANAQDTFLWVALSCQSLKGIPKWKIIAKLTAFPPGLNALYARMIEQINRSEDALLSKRVLACIATVYRPVTLAELSVLIDEINSLGDDIESIRGIIHSCGSLLTMKDDTIYFVHQSAKDYLCGGASPEIFPDGEERAHRALLSSSLRILSSGALHRDLYGLRDVGYHLQKLEPPDPDPLAALAYPCSYWIEHFLRSPMKHADAQDLLMEINKFLRAKCLYWIESLSLLQRVPEGVSSLTKLANFVQAHYRASVLNDVVSDAHRFIMYHEVPIANYPLQTYVSALLFSPHSSIIKQSFQHESPSWVKITAGTPDHWSPLLRKFERSGKTPDLLVFSEDSRLLLSRSGGSYEVRDMMSGRRIQSFPSYWTNENDITELNSAATFIHDSTQIVALSEYGTMLFWTVDDGRLIKVLKHPSTRDEHPRMSYYSSVEWSRKSQKLAWIWSDNLAMWDTSMGAWCVVPRSMQRVADGWRTNSDTCIWLIPDIVTVSFFGDPEVLLTISYNGSIQIWNIDGGECLKNIELGYTVHDAKFSKDASQLYTIEHLSDLREAITITIWNVQCGVKLRTFDNAEWFVDHGGLFPSGHAAACISVSHDDGLVAVVKAYDTNSRGDIEIWDYDQIRRVGFKDKPKASHNTGLVVLHALRKVASVSDNFELLAAQLDDGSFSPITVDFDFTPLFAPWFEAKDIALVDNDALQRWNIHTVKRFLLLQKESANKCALSSDSIELLSWSQDGYETWEIDWKKLLHFLDDSPFLWFFEPGPLSFSPDSRRVAVLTSGHTIKICDTKSGKFLQSLLGLNRVFQMTYPKIHVTSMVFSSTNRWLAVMTSGDIIQIWDTSNSNDFFVFSCIEDTVLISLDAEGRFLRTDCGEIDIEASSSLASTYKNSYGVSVAKYRGVHLDGEGLWFGSEFILYIPPEYRHVNGRVRICRDTAIIIDKDKRVWVYEFDLEHLPLG